MIRVDFFRYGDPFAVVNELEPYERRLIHDAVLGDHTLFTRAAGIERLCAVAAPQLEQPSRPCPRGSCIPVAVDELVASYLWLLPYPGHDDAEDPEAGNPELDHSEPGHVEQGDSRAAAAERG